MTKFLKTKGAVLSSAVEDFSPVKGWEGNKGKYVNSIMLGREEILGDVERIYWSTPHIGIMSLFTVPKSYRKIKLKH